MLLLECGRHSIFLTGFKLHLKYLLQVFKQNNKNRYTFNCFEHSIREKNSFYTNLINICKEAGLPTLFKTLSLKEYIKDSETLLLRLHEQEKQLLFAAVSKAQFHTIYKEIKSDFLMEDYLGDIQLPFDYMKLIFAARTEMLPIKYKPWLKGSNIDFMCTFCYSGESDSVIHILCSCISFIAERKQFLGQNFFNHYEGLTILKCHTNYVNLAKFLKEVFKVRKVTK